MQSDTFWKRLWICTQAKYSEGFTIRSQQGFHGRQTKVKTRPRAHRVVIVTCVSSLLKKPAARIESTEDFFNIYTFTYTCFQQIAKNVSLSFEYILDGVKCCFSLNAPQIIRVKEQKVESCLGPPPFVFCKAVNSFVNKLAMRSLCCQLVDLSFKQMNKILTNSDTFQGKHV